MSDMSLLERLEFITEKAKQIINRTSFITDYHQFLVSVDPEKYSIQSRKTYHFYYRYSNVSQLLIPQNNN